MPNTIVEHYRRNNPNDPRGDDEITLEYWKTFGPERLRVYPDFLADVERIDKELRKAFAPSLPRELSKSIASGVDTTQAKLYDTAALAGDVIGSKGLTEFGERGYKRNLEEAATNAPTIQDITEVEGIEDAARYAVGLAGSQAPQLAGTVGAGIVGGLVGGPPGAIAGAGGFGFTQMQNRGDLLAGGATKEDAIPTAIGTGVVGAVLEALVPLKITSKLLRGVGDDVAKEYFKRVVREIPVTAIEEGGTEVLQEITTMAGELYANRDNKDFKLTPDEIQRRIINAGAAGALLGGGLGPVSAIPGPSRTGQDLNKGNEGDISRQERTAGAGIIAPDVVENAAMASGDAEPDLVEEDLADPARDEMLRRAREIAIRVSDEDQWVYEDQTGLPYPIRLSEYENGPKVEEANLREKVESAAAEVNTNPTDAQKEAENYKQGHVTVQGLNLTIENPAGSVRSGVSKEGERWEVIMPSHYGKIKGTEGADGDHVDVYVGPQPDLPQVFVIDQKNLETGKFDEHKLLLGFPDEAQALLAYQKAFSDGKALERILNVTPTNVEGIKTWLEKGDQAKPFVPVVLKEKEARSSYKPQIDFNLELVDWDGAALSRIGTTHGKASQVENESPEAPVEERFREKAFFTVKREELNDFPTLAERLVSDGKATQSAKSNTRRFTFFEDQETVEIIGLPTWYTADSQRGGKIYRVTNPEEGRGVQLQSLMAGGRYVPVASVRFKDEVSGTDRENIIKFNDWNDFEVRLLSPARERLKATARYVPAMERAMVEQSHDESGAVVEYRPEIAPEEDPAEIFKDALVEELGDAAKAGDLTRDTVREAVASIADNPDYASGYLAAAREMLKDPALRSQLQGLSQLQQKEVLENQLTDKVYEAITGQKEVEAGGTPGLHSGGGVAAGGDFFSRPIRRNDGRAGKGDIKKRFAAVIESAHNAGLNIDIVQAVAETEEFGKFNGKERKITLVLADGENPSWDNLRLLLHEIGHDGVRGLRLADERIVEAVFRAVESISDEALSLENSTDPRIRESNPSVLQKTTLSEERLVEHLALQGIDRTAGTSIASAIIRTLKELYFRVALALQRVFGREPSVELAMDYVRNRFEMAVAGDTLYRFLIPPNRNISVTDEDLYSIPTLQKERLTADPKIKVQTKISAWNEQLQLEEEINKELSQVPQVVSAAKSESGPDGLPLTPAAWMRGVLRIPDARQLINEELKTIDPETGLVIGGDPNFKIGDFSAEQNRDPAAREAYILINKQWEQAQKKIEKLQERAEKLERERERAAKRYHAFVEAPKLPLPEEEEIKRKDKIKRWEKELAAVKKEIDELNVERQGAMWVAGLYAKKVNELAGPNQIHAPFVFGHKATYSVPTESGSFVNKQVLLDTNGAVMSRSDLAKDLESMAAWVEKVETTGGNKDGVYWRVKAQVEEFLKHQISVDRRKMGQTMTGLLASDMATQAKGQGTPLGRLVAQMINKFASQMAFLRPRLQLNASVVDRTHREAASLINVPVEYYHENFYNRAIDFLESRGDIVETSKTTIDDGFKLLKRVLLNEPHLAALLKNKEDTFLAALKKDVLANYEAAKFLVEHNTGNDVLVRDESLGADKVRKYLTRGILTIPRTVGDYFRAVFLSLSDANWASGREVFKAFANIYDNQGPEAAWGTISGMFNKKVIDGFFREVATEVNTESPFFAPLLEDGVTRPKANPGYIRQAWKGSGGNPVMFFEILNQLHGGSTTESMGQYVQRNLFVLLKYFTEMRRTMEQMDPVGMRLPKNIKTMIPGFMIDSREVEHWPSAWTTHVVFDSRHVPRMAEKIAAQVAFGAGNERLNKALNDGVAENQSSVQRLRTAEATVAKTVPSTNPKIIEEEINKLLGGEEEVKRLRKAERTGKFYKSIRDNLVTYFSNRYSVTKELGWLNTLSGLFASAMVNQPGSALSQMAEILTPFISFGPGAPSVRMVLNTVKDTAGELAYGLVRSLGINLQRSNREFQRAFEMGQGDVEQTRKIIDIFNEGASPFYDEHRFTRGLRKFREITTASMGSGTDYVGFRPLGLFNQVSSTIHLTSTVNFIKQVQDMVMAGVAWIGDGNVLTPEMADWSPGQWAGKLGLKGLNKDGFVKIFQTALDDHGIDYYTMLKKAVKAVEGGRDIIDNKTWIGLNGMWIKASTSQANIATITPSAFNNSILRFMLPLNGWAVRRTLQVAGLRLNEKGEVAGAAALSRGLLGLAALGAGGLGVSFMVDAYNEELLKKRRNLRRLTLNQSNEDIAYAILEHSARVGTFGLFGDLLNAATNVGTGAGDNRGLTFDGRIIFANSAIGLAKSVSNWINQDFHLDYANVIRPALFSVGGNGALQYMQLVTGNLGLDNVETRAVRRTNVHNWLRVAGRENEIELKSMAGGYGSPTPMTPYITKMTLAAYADDREGFMRVYREALKEAREQGEEDPADYIEKSFSQRHPLKNVFRNALTEGQYQKVVQSLPADGRQDVQEAINLFNRYAASIGVKPFNGRGESSGGGNNKKYSIYDLNDLKRQARTTAMFGF